MNLGWVSIHRQLQDNWLWEDKPFSYGQAWIDLILLANHAENRFPLGNEIVTVPTGSLITSELKLMDRWGWSKTKVRRFLALLENDSMIVKKTDRKKTTITIVNYSVFQESETTKRPKKDQKKTDERPIKDTNNNVNNDNNENNTIIYADDELLNQTIIAFVEHRKSMKKPMTDNAIKLLVSKLNKLSSSIPEQIEILNQSIMNGWQGIFPLKNQNNQKSGRKEVVPKWMAKEQNNYDFENLEDALLANGTKTVDSDPELKARADALKEKLANR